MKGFIEVNARRVNSGFMGKVYQPMIFSVKAISSITPRSVDTCEVRIKELADTDEHGNKILKLYEINSSLEAVRELLQEAVGK